MQPYYTVLTSCRIILMCFMSLRYYMLENRPRNLYGMVCHSCQNAPRNTKECKNNLFTTFSTFSSFLFQPLSSQLSVSPNTDLVSTGFKRAKCQTFICKWQEMKEDRLCESRCRKKKQKKNAASVFREQSEVEGSAEFSQDPLSQTSCISFFFFVGPEGCLAAYP